MEKTVIWCILLGGIGFGVEICLVSDILQNFGIEIVIMKMIAYPCINYSLEDFHADHYIVATKLE